jgi:hypothetical protein
MRHCYLLPLLDETFDRAAAEVCREFLERFDMAPPSVRSLLENIAIRQKSEEMMSNTPRTDAEEGDATNTNGEPVKVVLSSFARELERESAVLLSALEGLIPFAMLVIHSTDNAHDRDKLNAARAAIAKARGDAPPCPATDDSEWDLLQRQLRAVLATIDALESKHSSANRYRPLCGDACIDPFVCSRMKLCVSPGVVSPRSGHEPA